MSVSQSHAIPVRDGFRAHSSLGLYNPQAILSEVSASRMVIQDFSPLADSIEWQLGQRYWDLKGSEGFLSDQRGVPYVINNDSTLSWNAANLLFAHLVEAEQRGPIPSQIFTLELGVGVGLFARYFLDAFRELCHQRGKDYYERLCYIAADRSERMLWDFCRRGVLDRHGGHYQLRVVDASCANGEVPLQAGLAGLPVRPFQVVFLNYLLDCLPASVLRVRGAEVQQLCVQTCLARAWSLGPMPTALQKNLLGGQVPMI